MAMGSGGPQALEGLERLLVSASAGDRAALEAFLQGIERRVYTLAWRLLGDPTAAEDVTQETLLKICRNLDRYRPGTNLWGWIFRITVNQAHDYRSAAGPSGRALVAAGSETAPPYDAARNEQWQLVLEALKNLSEKERAALVLTELEGYTSQEAAHILGCLAITVRTRAAHARKNLRRELSRYYPEISEWK